MAGGVKAERRTLDIAVDPGLRPIGAAANDLLEGGIAGDFEHAAADRSGKRVGTMEAV